MTQLISLLLLTLSLSACFFGSGNEQKCQQNDAKACQLLGDEYFLKNGSDPNTLKPIHYYKEAMLYYQKACRLNNGMACVLLGDMHSKGIGIPKDQTQADEYYNKACDFGDIFGCLTLADTFHGVHKQLDKAVPYYEKACDLGYFKACLGLGVMFYKGKDLKQDKLRAQGLLHRACDLGEVNACGFLQVVNHELDPKSVTPTLGTEPVKKAISIGDLYN